MSGHSKWATIHRAKEVKDAKKGVIFTKMAAAVMIAVRQGGGIGDPEKNFRLRLAIEKARQYNLPKENIARAIEKGMGTGGAAALEEVTFEGFLPGGAAVLVETVTDNKLRTAQGVRMVLDKAGGSLAGSGSVSYMFLHLGEIVVDLNGKNKDEAELAAIDFGATDVEEDESKLFIFCEKDKTFEIKEKMVGAGYAVDSADLVMKPSVFVSIENPETKIRAEGVVDQLDELDDVTHVWSNYA